MPGLLRSYAEADFWNLLEERAQDIDFHFVQAANSERWRPEVLAEFQKREVPSSNNNNNNNNNNNKVSDF